MMSNIEKINSGAEIRNGCVVIKGSSPTGAIQWEPANNFNAFQDLTAISGTLTGILPSGASD